MKILTPLPPMPPSVLAQVAGLSGLPMAEIKALWRKLFKAEVPTPNRQFLERRLAYKTQEVECRRENLALLERNERRIAALIKTGKMAARYSDSPAPALASSRAACTRCSSRPTASTTTTVRPTAACRP
jgi:hypothetical protein